MTSSSVELAFSIDEFFRSCFRSTTFEDQDTAWTTFECNIHGSLHVIVAATVESDMQLLELDNLQLHQVHSFQCGRALIT